MNNRKKKKNIIIIVIVIILFLKIIPMILMGLIDILIRKENIKEISEIFHYDISNIVEVLINGMEESYHVKSDWNKKYIIDNNYNVQLEMINLAKDSKYNLKWGINDYTNIYYLGDEKTKDITFSFVDEGENICKIGIEKDGELVYEWSNTIYYIKGYTKQFLDEYSTNGVATHFAFDMDNNESISLLKALGVSYIRDDVLWKSIQKKDGTYSFENYDDWIQELKNNGIKIIAILNGPGDFAGTDKKVSNEEEYNYFINFANEFAQRYPEIEKYEVWNEPNSNWYTEQDCYWYSQMISGLSDKLKKVNPKIEIISGATQTSNSDSDTRLSSISFFNKIYKYGAYNISDSFSFHPYDIKKDGNAEQLFIEKIEQHSQLFNEYGGFKKNNVTEYGISTYSPYGATENYQAEKIIRQNILLDKNDTQLKIIYNFKDWSDDVEDYESNFGIVTLDLSIKPAYYAMKNYYENTNGAEYIGTLTEVEGITSENLEAHVYDKDGKPKIIVWSNNSNETITIPYKNFKATDLYGEEIQPNEDGNLIITTSPIYLDDVDYSYFYQAISNTATEKYVEFEEKFAEEISQVPDLESKLTQMKNYIVSVGKTTTKVLESASINAMKMHYELGNLILQAYKSGELQVEDVKVSSMLDMLDDIGDSYEDLVTVSAQNVSNIDMNQTNNIIQETETLINEYNNEIEIIYPVKILDFSKDYYDKATYINSLEEENPIKAGLIISNNLHGELLAGWANTFANIQINKYIDEYIANNPVTVKYSTTDFTNENVTATLETNAEIQVTNNSNSREYTFKENGSFTFEYTIKGRQFKITATVDNIDKEKPTITGIKNGRVYTHSVTPIITDKNLQKIELTFNGQVVKGYQSNIQLIDEGYYVITATDKAGNSTRVEFQILINQNKDYQIEGNIIKNITNSTTRAEFEKQLGFITKFTITRNGKEISEDSIIATGDVLTTEAGDSYTLIVTGDVNRDGKVTIHDIIKIRIYLVLKNNLDEIELIAADSNLDGKPISISDLIRVRILVLMGDSTN